MCVFLVSEFQVATEAAAFDTKDRRSNKFASREHKRPSRRKTAFELIIAGDAIAAALGEGPVRTDGSGIRKHDGPGAKQTVSQLQVAAKGVGAGARGRGGVANILEDSDKSDRVGPRRRDEAGNREPLGLGCPSSDRGVCGGAGECVQGSCACLLGFSGRDCSQFVVPKGFAFALIFIILAIFFCSVWIITFSRCETLCQHLSPPNRMPSVSCATISHCPSRPIHVACVPRTCWF